MFWLESKKSNNYTKFDKFWPGRIVLFVHENIICVCMHAFNRMFFVAIIELWSGVMQCTKKCYRISKQTLHQLWKQGTTFPIHNYHNILNAPFSLRRTKNIF